MKASLPGPSQRDAGVFCSFLQVPTSAPGYWPEKYLAGVLTCSTVEGSGLSRTGCFELEASQRHLGTSLVGSVALALAAKHTHTRARVCVCVCVLFVVSKGSGSVLLRLVPKPTEFPHVESGCH